MYCTGFVYLEFQAGGIFGHELYRYLTFFHMAVHSSSDKPCVSDETSLSLGA